ncbi:MAG: hypothetical protein ABI273_13655, partial [Lacunisphaera sp.]
MYRLKTLPSGSESTASAEKAKAPVVKPGPPYQLYLQPMLFLLHQYQTGASAWGPFGPPCPGRPAAARTWRIKTTTRETTLLEQLERRLGALVGLRQH